MLLGSRNVFLLMVLLVFLVLMPGCRTGDPAGDSAASGNVRDTLLILKEGHAAGELLLTANGSPFTVGQKTAFYVGPEDANLSFNGRVDFSRGEIPAADLLNNPAGGDDKTGGGGSPGALAPGAKPTREELLAIHAEVREALEGGVFACTLERARLERLDELLTVMEIIAGPPDSWRAWLHVEEVPRAVARGGEPPPTE